MLGEAKDRTDKIPIHFKQMADSLVDKTTVSGGNYLVAGRSRDLPGSVIDWAASHTLLNPELWPFVLPVLKATQALLDEVDRRREFYERDLWTAYELSPASVAKQKNQAGHTMSIVAQDFELKKKAALTNGGKLGYKLVEGWPVLLLANGQVVAKGLIRGLIKGEGEEKKDEADGDGDVAACKTHHS